MRIRGLEWQALTCFFQVLFVAFFAVGLYCSWQNFVWRTMFWWEMLQNTKPSKPQDIAPGFLLGTCHWTKDTQKNLKLVHVFPKAFHVSKSGRSLYQNLDSCRGKFKDRRRGWLTVTKKGRTTCFQQSSVKNCLFFPSTKPFLPSPEVSVAEGSASKVDRGEGAEVGRCSLRSQRKRSPHKTWRDHLIVIEY